MSISKSNIHKHEFLGRTVKVVSQSDKSWEGVTGKIVNETKNTFLMEINGVERVLPKKNTVLSLKIKDEEIKVDVSKLTFRPEDRIKKAKKRALLCIAINFQLTPLININNKNKE
jgi:ribonuclease P protein subunit POP4